jgi:hypothetical protein
MDVKQNELSQDSAQRRASLTMSYFRVLLQKIQLTEFVTSDLAQLTVLLTVINITIKR